MDDRKQDIKKWMLLFAQTDNKRVFSFTSGHLGALPISDNHFYDAISCHKFFCFFKHFAFLFFELFKFIIFSLLPLKNLALIVRTALRKFCNQTYRPLNSFCVISLGDQPLNHDAYFGRLLISQKESFDYIKIVGGYGFCSNNYFYVESALSSRSFILLTCSIIFFPFTTLFYSLLTNCKIKTFRLKLLYLTLCLKEINSSGVVNNLIILHSIKCALTNSTTKKILFPMEGRGWEKLVVKFATNINIDSIGYIHCALTPRHLSLINLGFYGPEDCPSSIVVPSEMILKTIQPIFPGVTMKKGYFLRGGAPDFKEVKTTAPNCLLFALTGNIKESLKIIDYIKASGVEKSNKVILKLNNNTVTHKVISNYAKKKGLIIFSAAEHFHPSICFFRSSSVALDYLKLDVMPVYLHLDEIITNNVFDLEDASLFQTLEVNNSFSVNLLEIIKRNKPVKSGKKLSRYYLDSTFADDDLMGLLI